MRTKFLWLFLLGVALGWASGGEPPAGGGTEEGEEPGRIVVTAGRLPAAPEKVGSSVSLFEGEDFERARPLDTWEQLRLSPGVTFVRSGTRGALTSLFLRGGESDHALVMLDGFKVNDDGGSFGWETLHPAGIGRAEILRGAGTPLFGADGMTGVVQIITARGEGDPRVEASVEAGTYHTTVETARLVGQDGPVAYNLNLTRFDMTEGRFENSDYRATTFAGRVDFTMPAGLEAKLVIHAMGDQAGNYTRDESPDPNSRVENSRELIGFELAGTFAELVNSRLKISRAVSDYLFDDPTDDVDTTHWRNQRQIERLAVDWQADAEVYRWGPAVGTLALGVCWDEEQGLIDARGTGGGVDSENHIDRTRTSRAVYAHKRLELWEALTVDGGVRVESHSTYGTETSARLSAALWLEKTGTKLHGSLGKGVKNPTFNENFDASTYDIGFGASLTLGNPDLDPEKVRTWDVGVEQHLFEDRVVLGATYFNNKFRDFINWEMDPFTFDSTYVNAGEARAHGMEYELAVRPLEWLRLRGALTVMHTEAITDDSQPNFADGRPLIRRPEKAYSILLTAEPFVPVPAAPEWTRGLKFFTEVIYDSGAKDVNWDVVFPASPERVKLASYTVVNAGINWEVVGGLRLFARVDNVFNEDYEQVYGISGARSTFRGGVGYALKF